MGDDIAGGVHAQHPDGAVEDPPGAVDMVVGDAVPSGPSGFGFSAGGAIDLDAAGAEVGALLSIAKALSDGGRLRETLTGGG